MAPVTQDSADELAAALRDRAAFGELRLVDVSVTEDIDRGDDPVLRVRVTASNPRTETWREEDVAALRQAAHALWAERDLPPLVLSVSPEHPEPVDEELDEPDASG